MKRSSSTIPFGYKLDETNTKMLIPIPEQIEALAKIVVLIKQRVLSLREGVLYLEHQTGRPLSHMGLKKIAAKA